MTAIRSYYVAQIEGGRKAAEVAAPKIVIDLMLMDKYHWTPKEIDDIPKSKMDEIMLALNLKSETEYSQGKLAEIYGEFNKGALIGSGMKQAKVIGSGGIKQRRNV